VKVIDRYGNTIKYHYEDGKLRKIYDCDPSNENNSIGEYLPLTTKAIKSKAYRIVQEG